MSYPKYLSHKEVSAVKIAGVEKGSDGSLLVTLEGDYPAVTIAHEIARRRPVPEVGWYLVYYEDGYLSFSPAQAFEQGYTPIEDVASLTEEPEIQNKAYVERRADNRTFNVIKGAMCMGNYENPDEAFDVADAENAHDEAETASTAS